MTSLIGSTILKILATKKNISSFKKLFTPHILLKPFTSISSNLAKLAANQLNITDKTAIVEICTTTHSITQFLLEKGADINKLAKVEVSITTQNLLRGLLSNSYYSKIRPNITKEIISISKTIPASWIQEVDYVILNIPLTFMDEETRELIVQEILQIINPQTGLILYVSHSPVSPIKFMSGNLLQRRIASSWKKIPLGFVWRFVPKRYSHNFYND